MNRKILEAAQKEFFVAMQKGWAGGAKGTGVPGMPKYKQIEYQSGDFRIVDQYGKSQAGKSEGTTRIWFCDDPVWVMSYGGFYRKEEVPFLKWALYGCYVHSIFNGGRGPCLIPDIDHTVDKDLIYINSANGGGSFERFRGREEIRSRRGYHNITPLGWHDYWGMALI
ncbi:MAG: hypothetical protein Q8P17_03980 [bacterium]|nr:hypothetical protein [bacterium]